MSTATIEMEDQLYQAVKARLIDDLGDETGLSFHRWFVYYREDPTFLYKVHELIASPDASPLADEKNGFTYQIISGNLYVTSAHSSTSFETHHARRALEVMIPAMERYLPLGSVVGLKKEEFSNILDSTAIESLKVVITQRLASLDETPVYFNYGGIIYPFGVFKEARSVYFTPELIDEVIHPGYSDDADHAFVTAMKLELLFRRKYVPYGFASKEQRRLARQEAAEIRT